MEKTETTAGTCTDPICGMDVEPENAAAKSEYEGKTYYFCCEDCKQEFDSHPQQYV
jgi:Cu+-exporting ATPase